MNILESLTPEPVFRYFEDLCNIPHGSGNTKQISDYCADFARKHNLDFTQDKMGNLIINKPGTKGYENHPAVIIQGHIDMVCVRDDALSNIDMSKDSLKLSIDGDFIHANGTTLGGDDGIAVAYCLAILASTDIPHPPIVGLLTVDEEIGLLGAVGIDMSNVTARSMINIDSEKEGVFLTSCAGGSTVISEIPVKRENLSGKIITLRIDGLAGGHSGAEIDKMRGNSNKLMARFLNALSEKISFSLVEIKGGIKNNAIPLLTEAVIICDNSLTVSKAVDEYDRIFKSEFKTSDSNVHLSIADEKDGTISALTSDDTKNVICMLTIAPDGIQTMSADVPGLVESSLNLGVLKSNKDSIYVEFSVRSSVASLMEEIIQRVKLITEISNGKLKVCDSYPAWEYSKNSKLRDTMIQAYKDLTGKEPVVTAIHAGLECGLFAGKLPGLDCISIGPDIFDIHTSKEHLSISSTQRVWELIIETLKRL